MLRHVKQNNRLNFFINTDLLIRDAYEKLCVE